MNENDKILLIKLALKECETCSSPVGCIHCPNGILFNKMAKSKEYKAYAKKLKAYWREDSIW